MCQSWDWLILLFPIVHVPIGIGSFSCCRGIPFPRSLPIFRYLGHSRVYLAGRIVQVPIEIGSFTCSIVHVLTGVNSFSCFNRYVSPLRFACLPRGDPYIFLRGLRSGLKNICSRSVLSRRSRTPLSLGSITGFQRAKSFSENGSFFVR
jgi:hypothetical protein